MPYTHTSLGDAKTALAARLGDTGKVYWVDAELGEYIREALQTWGLLTGYWRDTGTFNSANGTAFYDISTLQNGSSVNILSYATTNTTLATRIQYHLLEPAAGIAWTGSEQFTLADLTGALTRRRDQFLVETDARLVRSTQAIGAGSRTFTVADTTLAIKRVAWTSSAGVTYPLMPEDIETQRNYSTSFLNTLDIPSTYSSSSEGPLESRIAPPPNQNGTLDMLIVQSGADLSTAGTAVGVPDDMTWVVKWGAMADMLGREGPGQDLARSYFCERRYRLGVELSRLASVVLNAQINGIDLSPDTVTNLDRYNLNWQSSTNVPQFIASYKNYVALSPAPNGIFSVLLDVTCKAPLPTQDIHNLDIGREYLNNILDYAEHLAAFKCGGEEFRHTFRAADAFFQAALNYGHRLASRSPALVDLIRQSTADDYELPPKSAGNRPLEQRVYSSEKTE